MNLNHKTFLSISLLLAFVGSMFLLQYACTGATQQNALEEVVGENYVIGAINETFTKEDFVYGPQTWKPYASKLPIAHEDGTDGNISGDFYIMFVDLYAGPIGKLSNLTDSGAVRVEYTFENICGFAAFHVYGYCEKSNSGRGVSWTNSVEGPGASGYYVTGMEGGDASTPETEKLEGCHHIHVRVANGNGAKYDDYNDSTYYIAFDNPGGGLNSLHITTDPDIPAGQVTYTANQSGVFYVSDTGGRGFYDDVVLMVAVSENVPDDFELHIKSGGYKSPRGMIA
jgi:hypothetical protein